MLTFDDIRDELAKVSYKPGWRLIPYAHQYEGIWIQILAEVPDAEWPTRTTVLSIRSAIPPMPSREYLHSWLLWRILRAESHEVREFYRVSGEKLYDPHAPDANH